MIVWLNNPHKYLIPGLPKTVLVVFAISPLFLHMAEGALASPADYSPTTLDLDVMNEFGVPVGAARRGDTVSIRTNITNVLDGASFVLVVQIKDPDDRVISISDTIFVLQTNETRGSETLWIADGRGVFTIQAFVWHHVESPVSFSFATAHLQINESSKLVKCGGSAACFAGIVTKVIDGDTIDVDNIRIRLALVDTPERGMPGYQEATLFTSNICAEGSEAFVDEDDGQTSGSYGRMIAKVYCQGLLINEQVLESRHATILVGHCDESEFGREEWAMKYGC